ncbi:MAG: hypothetical protein Kow0010_08690 [Dehalococcoidia bacterium]
MSAKSDQLEKLETAYEEFRALIADLPDEAFGEMFLGEWNLANVLAHMAGWFREMGGAFERVGRGERPSPPGVDYSDVDAWNAKFAAAAKPGRTALDEFDAAFRAYRDAAAALREDLFGVDPEKGRPRIGDRIIETSGWGHFEEHLPAVREWLAART